MSYSNISGLDLFDMPFRKAQPTRSHASGQRANGQKLNSADLQPKTAATFAEQSQKPAESSAQHKRPETSAVPSHQTDAASRADRQEKPPVSGEKPQPLQTEAAMPEEKPVSAQPEETGRKEADNVPEQNQEAQVTSKSNVPADTQKQPEPQKELVLDMSAGDTADNPFTADDQEKRKAEWEALEAKRRAEWEQKQQEKKQKEEAELQKMQNMSDDEVVAASTRRISEDVERITRRNMKEAVAEYIISLCRVDPIFARKVIHNHKSISNCFRYINRMARSFLEEEMKNNGLKPENGIYGGDVPDDIIYQYSVDYYNSDNLPEDEIKEEKFVERSYTGSSSKPKKAASKAKKADKQAKKDKENQETAENGYEQMTLGV